MIPEQLIALEQLAKSRNYGRGPGHPKQVEKLSLKIYQGLVKSGLLTGSENDRMILSAAALLHDTGLPEEPHNKAAFEILKGEIPGVLGSNTLPPSDLSAILYCVLWHRGHNFKQRGDMEIIDPPYISKMAAILRVGDALDRSLQQLVEDISLKYEGHTLQVTLKSKHEIGAEEERAAQKADLMREAFNLDNITFKSSGGKK